MSNVIKRGTILITGPHGVGKSSFGLEAGNPERGLLIDDDRKGRATIDQLKQDGIEFGRYEDFISSNRGKKDLDIHMNGLSIINSIKHGDFDFVVWDTWTRFAATCHAYVQAHPNEFRDSWAANGRIKAGEEFKEARLYEAQLIAELQSRVPLVILVSHLKNQYINNAPTGKMIPAVSKAVDRVCNLRLWFKYNPSGPVPIALTLKNFDRKIYSEERGRLVTVSILPTKIIPQPGERSIWDCIDRYYESPAGLREALPHEIPNDFERSVVDGTLTEDQRLSWLYAIKQEKDREQEETLAKLEENRAEVLRLKNEEGLNLVQISKKLDLQMTDVIKMLSLEDGSTE